MKALDFESATALLPSCSSTVQRPYSGLRRSLASSLKGRPPAVGMLRCCRGPVSSAACEPRSICGASSVAQKSQPTESVCLW
ncbi:hypothetical protein MUK42_34914 [Musa troglodytarum]|uniref:Uncharacterized protein n=1 Tax=Musa troglodytarum TaxID=320322 RepID=A0A9E7H287_9LILI|nr:hypothetical protein MUK42_34914 [Musa troglodytarum]